MIAPEFLGIRWQIRVVLRRAGNTYNKTRWKKNDKIWFIQSGLIVSFSFIVTYLSINTLHLDVLGDGSPETFRRL